MIPCSGRAPSFASTSSPTPTTTRWWWHDPHWSRRVAVGTFIASDGTTVEQVEVELGFETGDRVEIVGAAEADITLTEGEQIVVVGAPALSDGAKIRLMDEEEAEPEPTEEAG